MKKLKEIVFNFLIYVVSFYLVYYLRKGTLVLTEIYFEYFFIFIISWLISSLLAGKFIREKENDFRSASRTYLVSFFFFLGMLSVFTQFFNTHDLSRILILNTLILPLVLELIFIRFTKKWKSNNRKAKTVEINPAVLLREIVILNSSIALLFIIKSDEMQLSEINIYVLSGLYICWIISVNFAGNLRALQIHSNKIRYLWSYIKSYLILLILSAFLLMFARIDTVLQVNYLTGISIYILISTIIQVIILIKKTQVKSDEVNLKLLKATVVDDYFGEGKRINRNGKYSLPAKRGLSPILSQKLTSTYLSKYSKVYTFLNKNVNLEIINDLNAVILKSSDPYNVEVLPENQIEFYLNLHEINDIRRINSYFREINKRLIKGGLYISRFEPTNLRYKRFMEKYPYYLYQAFYFFDFLLKRVSPKLPVIKKVYFALTNGRKRAISMAEGLGRLYYCGFEIIDATEIDNYVYFIAKKIKKPSGDKNPSYGPFFKMKRVGKNGKTIYVYKLRTMHPFSEYLQKFVYENFSLKEGGKFDKDFRITSWGRVFRKLWIDELPMLINLFKGDMKIVGVRPLSEHYLSLYKTDIKEKRIKYKPGLVPPYYADMPKTLEEIMDSEEKYLDSYEKAPITTDIKYFFKAFYNIIIKKARSG